MKLLLVKHRFKVIGIKGWIEYCILRGNSAVDMKHQCFISQDKHPTDVWKGKDKSQHSASGQSTEDFVPKALFGATQLLLQACQG